MSKVRVCFLGTPDFAVASLKALLEDSHYEVVGVVTQPDRPAGRKLQLTPSPVKVLAQAHDLKVVTPESLKKDQAIVEEISRWGAEVGVVVAFGQILTESFMGLFRYGCVNVHGSILPRWRGAAPIQRALEFGDEESGVTLQKMVKKLDAGDIIGIRKVKLTEDMTAMELHDHLAILGADLLRVELMDFIRGNLAPTPQDESLVTVARKIEKAESLIDWSLTAKHIEGRVRGFVYGPGTYTVLAGKKLKIHRVKVATEAKPASASPGDIISVDEDSFTVACGEGLIMIFEVQPESRNKISVTDFLKSHSLKPGDKIGV